MFAWVAATAGAQRSDPSPKFHPRRLLVKPKAAGQFAAEIATLHKANGARVLRTFPTVGGLQVVEFAGAVDIKGLVDKYRRSGAVQYAEPDYVVHATDMPNDPFFLNGTLWALHNIGLSNGLVGADMSAEAGWALRHDASDVIVAVVDTGIRYTHQDLAGNIWTNPNQTPGLDDLHGINAITGSGDPNDDEGHGTHVAGIIGAIGNNGIGVVGVAWSVQLMACKFLDATGSGYYSDAITCIDYAQAHGANVVNCSWGGGSYSQALADAIASASQAGIIFVAAAGNQALDNDTAPFYPASYGLSNMVVVEATTRADFLAYFSDDGLGSVDLGAPGMDIVSTWNSSDSAYASLSGTSMATPEVSGVFALMRAEFPGETFLELMNRVYASVDPVGALAGTCRTSGRVNLARCLSSPSSRPGNDDFANRIPISGYLFNFNIRGINIDGTKEPGEPDHAGNPGGSSIWWSWRPTQAGVATADTLGTYGPGTSFPALLAVYTGTNVASLTPVSASVGAGGVTFDFSAGTEYEFAVDGVAGATGVAVLRLYAKTRPPNDSFSNSIPITGTMATVTGSNMMATSEPGEPVPDGLPGGASVWWNWTPVVTGPATITTAGSGFNTILAVYTGTVVSNLTLVAANNLGPTGSTTNSRVDFYAVAGNTYQIAVDGYNGATGYIVLNTPPANDLFADRAPLIGTNASATGFNYLATKEPGEPDHAGNAGGKSLWWSWTAPASGTATVTTLGSSFATLLAIYTGTGLSSLSLVAADAKDAYGNMTSLVSFPAQQGTTYQIAVDGTDGASGTVQLQVSMGGQYVITEIKPLPGYDNSGAVAINNGGSVAGYVETDFPEYTSHACIWTASGGLQLLMTGDTESYPNDINDSNQIVGYLRRPGYGSIAFLWQNGVVTELGGLTSFPFSEAKAIDNSGRVVGWSESSNGSIHAFLWQNGIMTDLGSTSGGQDRSIAYGLAGPNYIVGIGANPDASGAWPLLWQNGNLTQLPLSASVSQGGPVGVNALGQAAGYCENLPPAPYFLHAFLWQNGTTIDLGAPSSGYSEAFSINNLGQVVGDDQRDATLYQNGRWSYLRDLTPANSFQIFTANKINDHGQIAAGSVISNYSRGLLLTPLTPVTPQAIILSPTNQQNFFAGSDIPITLWLVPDSTNVAQVDCFQGSTPIGTVTNAPYAVIWRNVPCGQYVLSAQTTTPSRATAVSGTVSINVIPPPSLSFTSGLQDLALRWPVSSARFVLESTTNLTPPILWQPVTNSIQPFNGSNATTVLLTNVSQFFRLHSFGELYTN